MKTSAVHSPILAVRSGAVQTLPAELETLGQLAPLETSSPTADGGEISRRLALKKMAVGAAALSLGVIRSPAPTEPPYNDNLGVNLDISLNGGPATLYGRWYSLCVDNTGIDCTTPIWKNLTGSGYVNNNFCGNSSGAGFASQGGYSDMIVGFPLTAGKIYQLIWNAQILNSSTTNDRLAFIHNNGNPSSSTRLIRQPVGVTALS